MLELMREARIAIDEMVDAWERVANGDTGEPLETVLTELFSKHGLVVLFAEIGG